MIFYTGDTHGKIFKITNAIRNSVITANDTIVILGDAGFNYYGNDLGDRRTKYKLNEVGIFTETTKCAPKPFLHIPRKYGTAEWFIMKKNIPICSLQRTGRYMTLTAENQL